MLHFNHLKHTVLRKKDELQPGSAETWDYASNAVRCRCVCLASTALPSLQNPPRASSPSSSAAFKPMENAICQTSHPGEETCRPARLSSAMFTAQQKLFSKTEGFFYSVKNVALLNQNLSMRNVSACMRFSSGSLLEILRPARLDTRERQSLDQTLRLQVMPQSLGNAAPLCRLCFVGSQVLKFDFHGMGRLFPTPLHSARLSSPSLAPHTASLPNFWFLKNK